jgi:hypothetical protein
MNKTIRKFTKGIQNTMPPDSSPSDSFTVLKGWAIRNGSIELLRGRVRVGADGGIGSCPRIHTAYKADGSSVIFRKIDTKIQYLNGTTWTDVITGLTAGAPTRFSNYSSLAGAFVFIYSTDGLYYIAVANPGSYASLYDSAKNFKGVGFIDKGRSILWGRTQDGSGLYGSWIDNQLGVSGSTGVYTSVSSEAITDVASGTLAFKAGGATRSCFGVQITDTSSGEVFTDNFNGVLTGSLGSTGTINYMTGAFTITGQSGAGTANYQWQNPNLRGVTDFSKSATRLAGEGFIFRQDIGGDAIQTVLPLEGSYYSMKKNSIYRLTLDSNDTTATNEVFRANVGVPSTEAATATSKGIILIDTSNGDMPVVRVITRNPIGDNFDMIQLFEEFDFSDYIYDNTVLTTYGDYVLISCKDETADANNNILMCNFVDKTVSVAPYEADSFSQAGDILYTGDSVSANVYETFTGFDDLDYVIENEAILNQEDYGLDGLKKVKKIRLGGFISISQEVDVYINLDNGSYEKIGNISGRAGYIDVLNSQTVGSTMIGGSVVGGSGTETAYGFLFEIKISTTKFDERQLKFVATGFGFVSLNYVSDYDIWRYEDRLPKKYRLKQNVDIDDSTSVDN